MGTITSINCVTGEVTTYEVADEAPSIPKSVTSRQGQQALLLAGLLDDAEAAINAIVDDTERAVTLLYWNKAQTFERDNPLIVAIGSALGLNSDAIDQLFITAAAL